jgi:hypothetical protein
MPDVIVFRVTAIWQLVSSLQHASTGTSSLLTSMLDILLPVSSGTLTKPLMFDTKVEAMLSRYRRAVTSCQLRIYTTIYMLVSKLR